MKCTTGIIDLNGNPNAYIHIQEDVDIDRSCSVVKYECLNQNEQSVTFTHQLGWLFKQVFDGLHYYKWYTVLNTVQTTNNTEAIQNDIDWLAEIMENVVQKLDDAGMLGG